MHLKRTRVEVPLPVEYTRVTNPERLRPLHDLAVEMMNRLRDEYEVIETPTFELIGTMRSFDYARPPITLVPVFPNEAPISVAFTTFPGLIVRCGKFFNGSFPVCGCDGCAPTFAREAERFQEIVGFVVAGQFQEEIRIPLFASAHLSWAMGGADNPNGSSSGEVKLPREDALRLSARSIRMQWSAWSKRLNNAGPSPVHSNTR